jgi:hypothetical protein
MVSPIFSIGRVQGQVLRLDKMAATADATYIYPHFGCPVRVEFYYTITPASNKDFNKYNGLLKN